MLADLCRHVGLNKWVIISKQIEDNNGRDNYKILEDIFEAFICAIFMDFNQVKSSISENDISGLGFQVGEKWIINVIEDYVDFAEFRGKSVETGVKNPHKTHFTFQKRVKRGKPN